MKLYRCTIIDDDDHAIEGLKRYIEAIPELQLEQAYSDPVEALLKISARPMTDFLFLDIDMPKLSGLELAGELRSRTKKLVFTTAHSKYGYEAFEVAADAYLLKPYSLAKFSLTIARLLASDPATGVPATNEDDFFFVKNKNDSLKIVKVRYADVIAVESQQNYVCIHSLDQKILTYMSLTEISKVFQSRENFVQYQRSFILNKHHIVSIDGNLIRMVNGIQITVGDYYRKDFNAFLDQNLIKARRRE